MLVKLMKYEFKATARLFLPAYGTVLAMAIVYRAMRSLSANDVLQMLAALVAIVLLGGMAALIIGQIISRFNTNLLSNEGYLMFTLPVKTDSLIFSKALTSLVWCLLTIAVAFVSIVIVGAGELGYAFDALWFNLINNEVYYNGYTGQVVLLIAQIIAIVICAIYAAILVIYTCLSLGLLVNRNKNIFAFVMFMVIGSALQALVFLLAAGIGFSYHPMYGLFGATSPLEIANVGALILLVFIAVLCALFHIITRHMLKNKLNL